MAISDELKTLARLPRSPYPFFTLYLNTRWDSEKQRERVRIFVKTRLREALAGDQPKNADARVSLEQDVGAIEKYVKGLVNREWDEGFQGIALFSCAGLGVHNLFRSHIPFEDALHWTDRPMLRPAVQQTHTGQTALLCLVGGSSSRLFEFEYGGLRREFRFHDQEFPSRHEQGGWSQSRYQRHVEEHLARNFKVVAEQLVKWADERKVKRVLLSGTEADVAAFVQYLPKRVAQVATSQLRVDPNATMDALQAEVFRALGELRQEEDRRALDALFEKGVGSGRAVSGPDDVARAVAAGKVHTLYVHDAFKESGWKCSSCQTLGVKVPLGCPSCGAPVETVELGEELIRGTLASDGSAVAVQDHPLLHAEGGVSALVRYG